MPYLFSPYDQFVLAFIVVVGTYGAVVVLLWLPNRSRYADFIRSFRGIAHNFLTVINVIFALNLAFLANDTWRAHDRALDSAYQEAGGLRSIVDLSEHLPAAIRAEIQGAVRAYATLTVTAEWPALARRESSPAVTAALDRLLSLLSSDAVAAAANDRVHAQMLAQALDVRSSRDLRIALSQTHVNPLKWLGMVFLGFLTMVSIVMVHVDVPRAQVLSVLLFATAAAPSAAIILVHGNPFQEPMAVEATPIASILDSAVGADGPQR